MHLLMHEKEQKIFNAFFADHRILAVTRAELWVAEPWVNSMTRLNPGTRNFDAMA